MYSIKNLVYVLIITFLLVNIILNVELRSKIKGFLNKKIFKSSFLFKDLILGVLIVIVVLWCGNLIKETITNFKYVNTSVENQEQRLEKSNSLAEKTLITYKKLIAENQTDLEKSKNPYIPEGFKHTIGEWNTGFVIEDENKNEFVWIPVSNRKNSDGIEILKKKNFVVQPIVSYYYCYEKENSYEKFIKSSLQNGGFYISRYEIKNEEGTPVSKQEGVLWNNITYSEASKISKNMYKNINSNLLNGFAYDTAFSFILQDVNSNLKKESTTKASTNFYKNIYDMLDDIYEITEEEQFECPIIRGITYKNKYVEENTLDNRLIVEKDYKAENLGFRIMLYK